MRKWWELANCKDADDPDIFFQIHVEKAIEQYCKSCQVKAECFQEGFDLKLQGVWGGTSANLRTRLRRLAGL